MTCGPFKEKLEKAGIRFLYLDITSSLGFLKKYLAIRETAEEFKPIIEEGGLGIPFLAIGDNERFIFDEKELDEFIAEELAGEEE
ncbi:MAG: glutaredoxin [Tissierellia bacterium]|nr:glutaredoxin [Tissierellia bacterium]